MRLLLTEFKLNPTWLIFQGINFIVAFGLLFLAIRSILARGKGIEIPIWCLLCTVIPIIMPVVALIHFRKSKAA